MLDRDGEPGEGKAFVDMGEIDHALAQGVITLHSKIKARYKTVDAEGKPLYAQRKLQAPLEAAGISVSLIGGADVASELDAKRAIDQGTRLAASL